MQRKLTTWTADDENRRVNRLLRLISHPDWLHHAAERALSSKGARTPGVDGITKYHLQEKLGNYLRALRLECSQVITSLCRHDASIFLKRMGNSAHWGSRLCAIV